MTGYARQARRLRTPVCVALGAAVLLTLQAAAMAQTPMAVARAKALYDNASYEEALAALRDSDTAEAHQYRALCLMALGRTAEAERALESLVIVEPTFVPSEADVPPRLLSLLNQTRSRVMPGIMRQLFADARALFVAKEYEKAGEAFERLLDISNDPVLKGSEHAEDLRILIAGFIDLVNATPVAAPPAPSAPSPSASVPSPAATPVPQAAENARPVAPTPVELTPAKTVRQQIPAWNGRARDNSDPASAIIRVTIGVDGKVKDAAIEKPVDPAYDARLLLAARSWLYEPARLRGEPVESTKIIEINVTTD
jgi:tetratricopeptide (TPR) repeat protein